MVSEICVRLVLRKRIMPLSIGEWQNRLISLCSVRHKGDGEQKEMKGKRLCVCIVASASSSHWDNSISFMSKWMEKVGDDDQQIIANIYQNNQRDLNGDLMCAVSKASFWSFYEKFMFESGRDCARIGSDKQTKYFTSPRVIFESGEDENLIRKWTSSKKGWKAQQWGWTEFEHLVQHVLYYQNDRFWQALKNQHNDDLNELLCI